MCDIKNELEQKKYKTFTDYYQDPEYKKKHKAYMATKVQCIHCRKTVTRANMTNHTRTLKCQKSREMKIKAIDNIKKLTDLLKLATNLSDPETAKKLKENIFSISI